MTGADFQRVRTLYGETQLQFGRRCGWEECDETVMRKVRAYERGERPIEGPLAALLDLLDRMPAAARKPLLQRGKRP